MSATLPHIARRATVMRIILDHIGQVMPTSRMIAYDLGCTTGQVDHSIRAMCDAGEIVCIGNGGSRVIVVPGVGETLPRMTGKEVAAYTPRPVEPEPVRVFNFACPRCGVRNCARHSPAPLITRAAAAMVLI